ncbi:MAG: alpha-mannosidase [Aggregatilineales bacterium]
MNHDVRTTHKKITRRLELIAPLIYRRKHLLSGFRYLELPDVNIHPASYIGTEVNDSHWHLVEPRTYWAQQGENFILRGHFSVPEGWDTATPIALHLPIGNAHNFLHPEALIYVDGKRYATVDRFHQEILLDEPFLDGEEHLIVMHGWTGMMPRDGQRLFMGDNAVVQIHQATREFYVTAQTAHELIDHLEENDPIKHFLLNALDDAFKLLDIREPIGDNFYASIPTAHETLRAGIAKAGESLDLTVTSVGHAHIDVAWLWTLGQTRRKSARTFTTVNRLMDQFPEYIFAQSQPQLYDYIRQDDPELFEQIKERVAEGRWEPLGGMWIEADCNISGGESLVRQFLLGRKFFSEHFGEKSDSPVLWLPDVFGYAWNLPQLIKEAGLEYFFTIKIGWNQINKLPYSSFWWQGLDGTKVLTHFSTTPEAHDIRASATYNAEPNAKTALGTWLNYNQKAGPQDVLMAYGWGDGGGGPTREMLNSLREMQDFPGLPKHKTGKVIDFFRNLETQAENLPVWNGELYLEIHRGTYTTQARNKRANRKSEFMLHDAEFLATVASLLDETYAYPYATFNEAWELVCLNQFHDIIPGSSIHEVYVESLEQYEQVREMVTSARDDALAVIRQHIAGDVLVINPTSSGSWELATFPEKPEPVAVNVMPYSVQGFTETYEPELTDAALIATTNLLENVYLRVEINDAGDITRIYDKLQKREVLPEGEIANQWIAFEDRPNNWDAWDVDMFYDDKSWFAEPATSIELVEDYPLRATIEIKRRILNSDYVQRVSLSAMSKRIDFDTSIHWRERHILLKTAFPVDILSPVATYEIQWGRVQRPTHRNTSWDWARFETCAQKWVDLSEAGFGVALINDCKYGYDIHDNVMRMSLLRSTTYPDPEADQGEHTFKYSLFVHDGYMEALYEEAYHLNDPHIVTNGDAGVRKTNSLLKSPFVVDDGNNLIIETIKRAEDGEGVIVRGYEYMRWRGDVTVITAFPMKAAYRTNILEENQEELSIGDDGHSVSFTVTPFKIVTLRLIPV